MENEIIKETATPPVLITFGYDSMLYQIQFKD